MKLHGYFRSSASYRVRIALNLKGLSADHLPHHLRRGEQRDPPYLAINPQGLVPTLQDDAGFVRVVARSDNHVVLGVHAVGAGVSELSAAFSLALEMGARLEDIALTIHAHPTLSEAFHESALAALGHPLHI